MQGEFKHILSTRPLEISLLDRARAAGILLDTRPFIETRPVVDPALTERVRSLALRPLAGIFTSANAVEAVAGHLRSASAAHAGEDRFSQLPWKIFCIG